MQVIDFLIKQICVKSHIFKITEDRDRKIIIAMSFMVYVSALLAGYSMYVNVEFLLRSSQIALLLGLCTTIFLTLHDQSMMATEKKRQIYSKLIISLILAVSFTLTNNADKDYQTLSNELKKTAEISNSYKIAEMNAKIEAINKEELEILKRTEKAAAVYKQNRQPLNDARQTMKAYLASKDNRIALIKESYKNTSVEAQISDLNILILQAKKFASGGEGTLIAMILAFLFFIIEALPAILRLMLDDGDYMTRFLASLFLVRDLRDQRIEQQRDFASAESDIISNLLHLEIIAKKSDLISNGFEDTEEMIILDQRQKVLIAGVNPYTGKPLDYIDPNFFIEFKSEESYSTEEKEQNPKDHYSENGKSDHEPVFDL